MVIIVIIAATRGFFNTVENGNKTYDTRSMAIQLINQNEHRIDTECMYDIILHERLLINESNRMKIILRMRDNNEY